MECNVDGSASALYNTLLVKLNTFKLKLKIVIKLTQFSVKIW